MFIAGFLFLAGALGVETLSGLLHWRHDELPYLALTYTAVEEFLEMTAVSLAIASLATLFEYNIAHKTVRQIAT